MKLRLVHQLFLLVAASALVAALAMAALLSVNLSRGFDAYLVEQDAQKLIAFAQEASASLTAEALTVDVFAGGTNAPGLNILRSLTGLRPVRPDLAPGWRPPPVGSPPQFGDGAPPRFERRPPGRRGPIVPPMDFTARLMLFTPEGAQFAGPPPPPLDGSNAPLALLQQPIELAGETIALAKVLPRGPRANRIDQGFLLEQYRAAGILAIVLIAVSAVPATIFARRGAARLAKMQRATDAIAKGNLAVRTPVSGDDELSIMARNINDMAASLQQLEAARARWLAEIGHELRTPMTVLVGEIEALQKGVRPLTQDAVTSLSEEASRLALLIEDLQFLAMSDLKAAPCHFAPDDAAHIVQPVIRRFRPELEHAGLALDVRLADGPALPVVWDSARIQQLLANLLTNSRRYTDAPGRVRVALSHTDKKVTLRVDDTAPGVSALDMTQLFVPLYRVEASRSRARGGSGLGLSVCQSIVRAHGGHIRAELSALGGLAIVIELPLNAALQTYPGGDTG
ncbi:MAG: ATP-binding protein [Pseudomonadota bacterium]